MMSSPVCHQLRSARCNARFSSDSSLVCHGIISLAMIVPNISMSLALSSSPEPQLLSFILSIILSTSFGSVIVAPWLLHPDGQVFGSVFQITIACLKPNISQCHYNQAMLTQCLYRSIPLTLYGAIEKSHLTICYHPCAIAQYIA